MEQGLSRMQLKIRTNAPFALANTKVHMGSQYIATMSMGEIITHVE
jgi:hypothetical protein